jgi:hypothetical protein
MVVELMFQLKRRTLIEDTSEHSIEEMRSFISLSAPNII